MTSVWLGDSVVPVAAVVDSVAAVVDPVAAVVDPVAAVVDLVAAVVDPVVGVAILLLPVELTTSYSDSLGVGVACPSLGGDVFRMAVVFAVWVWSRAAIIMYSSGAAEISSLGGMVVSVASKATLPLSPTVVMDLVMTTPTSFGRRDGMVVDLVLTTPTSSGRGGKALPFLPLTCVGVET